MNKLCITTKVVLQFSKTNIFLKHILENKTYKVGGSFEISHNVSV